MPSNGDFGVSGLGAGTTPASGGNFSSLGSPVGVGGTPGSDGLFGCRFCATASVLTSKRMTAKRNRITVQILPCEMEIRNVLFAKRSGTHFFRRYAAGDCFLRR